MCGNNPTAHGGKPKYGRGGLDLERNEVVGESCRLLGRNSLGSGIGILRFAFASIMGQRYVSFVMAGSRRAIISGGEALASNTAKRDGRWGRRGRGLCCLPLCTNKLIPRRGRTQ